jgi:acyl-CoA thioesterase-2
MLTEAFELRRRLDPARGAERGLDLAVRAAGRLPDDPHLHAALLVWASDMFILDASLLQHQSEPDAFGAYAVATVDHAVHLHAPVRLDEWVLNRFDSPLGGGGLSEVRCEMRTTDGALVASAFQHALLAHNRPA